MASLIRLVSVFFGFLLLTSSLPCSVFAANPPPPGSPVTVGANKGRTSYAATITTGGHGVWIDVRGRQSYSGQYVVPSSASGSSLAYGTGQAAGYGETSNGSVYHLEGINIGFAGSGKDGWFTVGSRLHPGSVPKALYVNGNFQGIVWVPVNGQGNVQLASAPSGNVAGAASAPFVVDPRALAMDALQHIPLPNVLIRMNPSLGLVAMPGWFWAEGYNGQPFGGSATVGTYTVAVQVEPMSYTWDFGDGSTLVSHSLGKPYPAESDIQHTYQYSSLHYPDGFPLRLTIQFAASYSVNGGPAEPLSAMERTYTAGYRVQELQSILTNR